MQLKTASWQGVLCLVVCFDRQHATPAPDGAEEMPGACVFFFSSLSLSSLPEADTKQPARLMAEA